MKPSKRKLLDSLGNEVKPGDVLIEPTGGNPFNDDTYKCSIRIWEMPETYDGHGYDYSIDGQKHKFAWASVRNSFKVDFSSLPKEFQYSFKHGMERIYSKHSTGTAEEIIKNSNWKIYEIQKEKVDRHFYLKTLKIETMEDLKANVHELSKGGYIPGNIVDKTLELVGVNNAIPHNGEIGLAALNDHFAFSAAIIALAKDPDCFA